MQKDVKRILKTIGSKVFTNVELSEEDVEFLVLAWAEQDKHYKKLFKHTWDIKLADYLEMADFSPRNFFIRQSLIKKTEKNKGAYNWIAEETAQIHKDILMGKAGKEGKGYKIFKSNKMKIVVQPSKRLIILTENNGLKKSKKMVYEYQRQYELSELPLFKNIMTQMLNSYQGPLNDA